ncbi:MAG: HAD family hydrolase [Chloroflexi bacterium]|nr:HAD family hydrolase [Chloroflexota bacterium]
MDEKVTGPKLVIFDLDQTLVDFIPIHDSVTLQLFRRFYGVDARLTEIDFAGRSLADNFLELGRLKGIPEDRLKKDMRRILAAYEETFARNLPQDASRHVLPGVAELLAGLSQAGHVLALYTGDSKGIVDAVMRVTGLGRFFRFAFYGTEVAERSDMVKLAMEKAREATGRSYEGKDVVVIGDSVRDVDAGKRFGALTIAVATGFHGQQDLARRAPDYLFPDLSDYRKIVEAIG